eukprot:TRINITY_DN637_c0_g1_i2.p1 TRINITY_DN637_c0_g1~~TRINITY_DN637_c0_g1_i2.p1  ORF type:complete len:133 (-),score=42.63 TRINITY_DN637_c0_g1_i2:235-633(-)
MAAANVNASLSNNEHLNKASGALSPGYQEGLFGCFSDIMGCLVVCCLPQCTLAVNRANTDERPCHILDCLCCVGGAYVTRQSIRAKYKKEMAPVADCLAACCCPICFIHQDARELAVLRGKPAQFYQIPGSQ